MKKKSRTAATNLSLFLIALPGILYLLINNYAPMLGIFLAFKNYSLMKGPFKSDWCGFDNFEFLFKTKDAWIMTRNTLLYNTAFIIIGTVAAILVAILMCELGEKKRVKFYQAVMLLPNLLSWVVIGFIAYDDNIPLLKNRVETHAFIRNISKHRLPDGTLDVEGNLKLWNDGMQGFVKTPLWEKTPGWREDTHLQGEPYLVFVPGNPGSPTILIAHGGGFSWRTGCEGPNVAWYFHQAGYNTAILSYRLLPYDRYASMADMQRAIRLLRARKEEFGIGEKIVVMGFSAGGMICGNCATHFDNGSQTAPDLVQQMSSRPDACVIGYGAMSEVSFPQPFMMEQPEHSLFGDTPKDKFYLATEKNVRPDSPPFFIWQTLSDDGRHGLCLAKALQDAGVPYELHIFEGGVHGLGLADGENDLNANVPHIAEWGKLCTGWLDLHNLGGEHEKQ